MHNYMKTTFVIGPKASNIKPGKAKGETLLAVDEKRFKGLEGVKNWRRMLDESFVFTELAIPIDGAMWASVGHYKFAQYFKHDMEFMATLTATGKYGKEDMAFVKRIVESKSGSIKKVQVRPKKLFPIEPPNLKELVTKATLGKMRSSPLLGRILCETHNALLVDTTGEVDDVLMSVRDTVCKEMGLKQNMPVVQGKIVYGPPTQKTKPKKVLGGSRTGRRPDGFNKEIADAVRARQARIIPSVKRQTLEKSGYYKKINRQSEKVAAPSSSKKKSKAPDTFIKIYEGKVLKSKAHPPMVVVKNVKKIPKPVFAKLDEILNPNDKAKKEMVKAYDAGKFIAEWVKGRKMIKNKRKNLKEKEAAALRLAEQSLKALKNVKNKPSDIDELKESLDKIESSLKKAVSLKLKGEDNEGLITALITQKKFLKRKISLLEDGGKMLRSSFKPRASKRKESSTVVSNDKITTTPLPEGLDKHRITKPKELTKQEKIQEMRLKRLVEKEAASDLKKHQHTVEKHHVRSKCPFCERVVFPQDESTGEKSRFFVYICKNEKCPKVGVVLGEDEFKGESFVPGKRAAGTGMDLEFT